MYRIIATQDFIDLLGEIPIKYLAILINSFISIDECDVSVENESTDNTFMEDLLSQLRNQELE